MTSVLGTSGVAAGPAAAALGPDPAATLQTGTIKFSDIQSRIAGQWKVFPADPVDFSFKEISHITDLLNEEPRTGKKKAQAPEQVNTAIRLSNNLIASLADLPRAIEPMLTKLTDLTWLDVSFNLLTTIDAALLHLPNLGVLYLHANQIDAINEVDQLGQLPHLRNLTLHGNPLESTKGYRYIVLARVPQLRHLDFCAITKQDRIVARTMLERTRRRRHDDE
ncbi:hypothetical protein BC831DRAFT_470227, partial [Entophlyctis helioformis]